MTEQSNLYIRTCQECGLPQEAKPPADYKSDAWRDVKCERCKSMALDYGSWGWTRNTQGKLIRPVTD